ncbi:MAG: Fe-S cluster assembly protein SufD [Proteobacteria bacterium]|nr:Fe-S cluster assembly protein SufD [Pseudomonadota bacterium]
MAGDAPFVDQFSAAAPLPALRAGGLARYRAAGLPGPAIEAWKYTSLDALTKLGLLPAGGAPTTLEALPEAALLAVDGYRAVFVNGRFVPAFSALDGLPKGAVVESLAAHIARDPAAAEAALAGADDGTPLVALNTAFLTDGLVLTVDRGVVLDKPLHLVSIGRPPDGQGVAFHPRHLIRLAPDAVATVVESHAGVGGAGYFANTVADIRVEDGATLRHYVLQNQAAEAFHVAAVRLALAARASYEGFVLHIGARLARHELAATIAGDGVDCRMNGLYLVAGSQHVDNTTFIDHAQPGSRSRQLFKGVLDDSGRGVFQGRVLVRPHAQKTDAHQLSRALLLSRKAEMDGKPELEIYADDVRCSHGATIGSLDQEPMFYLMSRGIDPATAYRMLVEAFAVEALDEISVAAIRDAFATHAQAWLATRRAGGGA